MERHIGPWDQRPATYVAFRDFVGNTPHGGPGFLAYVLAATPAGMFGPAELWDGERWVEVPVGWYVAHRGKYFHPLAPEDHAAMGVPQGEAVIQLEAPDSPRFLPPS